MKPEDIVDEEGILRYIEGVINDRVDCLTGTPEASFHIIELITFLIKKDRVNQELRRKEMTEENKAAWRNPK